MTKRKIHIGTSGWSYSDWKGLIYPTDVKSSEWLTYYSGIFDTTEINSSFYRMTREKTVLNWADKVPKHFKFCPKISQYLTHSKKLHEPEEPLQRFFGVYGLIKQQLGPVLIQLPPSLKFNQDVAAHFFGLLNNEYADYDFALEVRHQSWLEQDALDMLTECKIPLVISQSGVGFPYTEVLTSDIVYFRFHGPAKLYGSRYTEDVLRDYATKFRKWHKDGKELWIFFNNTMHGYGYDNARTLMNMINEK